jgi:hypothetical protein
MFFTRYIGLALAAILGLSVLPAHGQDRKSISPTDTELMMLPPYCHARLKGDANTKKMWGNQMGNDIFVHLHHYCFGLNFMNRIMFSMDDKEKAFLAKRAASNFDYVIQRWPPSHPLAMEARQRRAQLQLTP